MSTRRFRKYQQSLLDAQQPQVEPTGPGILEFLGYKGPTAGSDFVYDQVTPTAEARSAGRAFDAYGKMGRSFREGDYFSGTGYLGTALSESLASIPIAGPVIGLGLTGARSLVKPVVEGVTPFFSKLTNTLTESPQKKGTGKQFLSLLDKKGVKKEEQELTGIRTLLEQNPDRKFTSDELVNTAELNAVEVEEVRRGELLPPDVQQRLRDEADDLELQEAGELADDMLPEALELEPNPYDIETQTDLYEEYEAELVDRLTRENLDMLNQDQGYGRFYERVAEQKGYKYDPESEQFMTGLEYGEYFQQSPDGDNFRELVLRMPNPDKPEVGYVVKSYSTDNPDGKIISRVFENEEIANERIGIFEQDPKYNDASLQIEPFVRTKDFNKDRSYVGHFPESNQILHIRTSDEYPNTMLEYSDRTRSKDLYVQEIQSDTAQRGRGGFFDEQRFDEVDESFKEIEEKVSFANKKVQMLEGQLRQKLARNERENERIANAIFKDYRDENAIVLMHTPFDLSKEDYVNHYTEKALNYNLMKQTESPEFNKNNSIQVDDEYKYLLGQYYDAKINQKSLREPYEELNQMRNKERNKPPELPYTSSTEKTNELALKRLLLEAVDGGYDRLTLTSGEAVVDAFGEPGLKTVYDNILPKQLQKIVKKLDPNAKVKRGTSTIPNYKAPYEPSLELQGAPTDAGDEKINYDYSTRTPGDLDMQITVQFDPVRREVNLYDYSLDDKPIKRMDFEDYEDQFLKFTDSYERLEADDPLRSIDNMLANGYELGEADFVEQYLTSTRFRKEAEGSEFYELTILELSPKLKETLKKGLPIMAGAGVTAGLLKEQEKQKGEGLLN